MNMTRAILVAVVALMPAAAFGQAQYKAEEVIKRFTEPAKTGVDEKGVACPAGKPCLRKAKTRAICVGTDSECAGTEVAKAAAKPKGGFDLLITFELGSDQLSDQAKANLREFAKALNSEALKDARFNVDGHTDARGSKSLNAALSERRAASVVAFLKSLGVDEARLKAKGYGELKPKDADPFAPINRRVEATIRTR